MSHEDQDVEVPAAKLMKDELKAIGSDGPPPDGAILPLEPPPTRGEITWQVIVAGVFVAVLMGLSYPY
ncbi:MAG: hypothetical protein ABI175_02565, partial [Polyangiales bacterium]